LANYRIIEPIQSRSALNGLYLLSQRNSSGGGSSESSSSGGEAAKGSADKTNREPWTLTKEGASVIKNHNRWGNIYKSSSDGLWWAFDKYGHGGSKFKVFKEGKRGLEWVEDADEFGDFMTNKHKGPTGIFIPWGELSTIK